MAKTRLSEITPKLSKNGTGTPSADKPRSGSEKLAAQSIDRPRKKPTSRMSGSKATTGKIIRSSVACAACRSKKHRCSGEKPRCTQCTANDLLCEWPAQQKRGPPKQYIQALENRLAETEKVLLALLSQVSIEQLQASFPSDQSPQYQRGVDVEETQSGHRDTTGVMYWKDFPISSPETVQNWWSDRMSRVTEFPSQYDDVADRAHDPIEESAHHPFHENTAAQDVGVAILDESERGILTNSTNDQTLHQAAVQDSGVDRAAQRSIRDRDHTMSTRIGSEGIDIDHDQPMGGNGTDATRSRSDDGNNVLKLSDQFKRDYVW